MPHCEVRCAGFGYRAINSWLGGHRMRKSWRIWILIYGLMWSRSIYGQQVDPNSDVVGVVVEEVGVGTALAMGGIESGDLILKWRHSPLHFENPGGEWRSFNSAFDWWWLEFDQAYRGKIELSVQRSTGIRIFEIKPGLWQTEIRPRMLEPTLGRYLKGQSSIELGKIEQGVKQLAETARSTDDWRLRCWLRMKTGTIWTRQRNWSSAEAAYELALKDAGTPIARTLVLKSLGKIYREQRNFDQAQEAYTNALTIQVETWGEVSLMTSQTLQAMGVMNFERRKLAEAERLLRRALDIQRTLAPSSLDYAGTMDSLGILSGMRGDLEAAERSFQEALGIKKNLAPNSTSLAATLSNLGIVAKNRGDLSRALEFYRSASEIDQRLAPRSKKAANTLHNMGNIARQLGNLDEAERLYRKSLDIYLRIDAGSLPVANTKNGLGVIARRRGNMDLATKLHYQALEIQEGRAPNSLEMASTLTFLGTIARRQGFLARAKDFYEKALGISHEVAPDSLYVAAVLSNLGNVSEDRGDWGRARGLYAQALAIQKVKAPSSSNTAITLVNLGIVAMRQGDFKEASALYTDALEIQRLRAPKSSDVAATLLNLGRIELNQHKYDQAKSLFEEALAIQRKVTPGGFGVAEGLYQMATMYRYQGDLAKALDMFHESLKIRERLAPSSAESAELLHEIGLIHRREDPSSLEKADSFFRRALDRLETHLYHMGGSHDTRSNLRSLYHNLYGDAVEVQVERKTLNVAFNTLERSRARTFLELLAERDTIFKADIGEELDSRRRRLAARYDHAQQQLAGLSVGSQSQEVTDLQERLRKLRERAEDVEEEIRHTSPRLASLQYPQPLDGESSRRALDPGTLVLSYSVGENSVLRFSVSRAHALDVEEIAVSEADLRRDVSDFLELIRGSRVAGRRPGVERLSRSLYKNLLGSVEDRIETSERLLIIADGPLHYLPWAALRRDAPGGESQYLVEWKPCHLALSLTVYSELLKQRRKAGGNPPPVQIAAFGDPRYPGSREVVRGHGDLGVRSVAERAFFDWGPLPYTRQEVEGIVDLYEAERVRKFLGDDATEENAKSVGRAAQIYHFAVHGYLDESLPLNSFLALSVPEHFQEGKENGLLQIWEIFERVRINADLVVLSACDSGVGADQKGEGLIGLTRAFQYAGARSVLAALWNVADGPTTAGLMVRFYGYLKEGRTKDEALRAAQLDFLREPLKIPGDGDELEEIDASAPYYWAAFQIYGDWK